MTEQEINTIQKGDRIYVNHNIDRTLGHYRVTAFKVNNFYTVRRVIRRVFQNVHDVKIIVTSEVGFISILLINRDKVKPYVPHFNLLKEKDYQEIVNFDYFAEL